MDKHITILKLITLLKSTLDFSSIEFVDYWDADLCAIGFKKAGKLVYVSTANFIHRYPIKYDFDLEIINPKQIDDIRVVKSGHRASQFELISEIKLFFEL